MLIRPDAHAWSSLTGRHPPDQGDITPNYDRADPYPPLVATDHKNITMFISLGASVTEITVTRQLRGPAFIRSMVLSSNSINAITVRMVAGIVDDDAPTATELAVGENLLDSTVGDTYTLTGMFTTNTTAVLFPIDRLTRRGLFRIALALNNSTVNPILAFATFGIDVLKPAPAPHTWKPSY